MVSFRQIRGRWHLLPVLLLVSIAAPTNAGPLGSSGLVPSDRAMPAPGNEREGRFRLLTYNVAGLPEGLSASRPKSNLPHISPLLNDYDMALVQEDFSYPGELRSHIRLPHRSVRSRRRSIMGFGDGLSRFTRLPFLEHVRVRWRECHGILADGADCLAYKGFTVATHRLAQDVHVDVYNVHMDSGTSVEDRRVRAKQARQLLDAIEVRSSGRAAIVAGDTNMWRNDRGLLDMLLREAGLQDACRTLSCGDPGRIDRVLYRSASELTLGPRAWYVDRRFVDADGDPLSDHQAVGVDFRWDARGLGARRPTQPSREATAR